MAMANRYDDRGRSGNRWSYEDSDRRRDEDRMGRDSRNEYRGGYEGERFGRGDSSSSYGERGGWGETGRGRREEFRGDSGLRGSDYQGDSGYTTGNDQYSGTSGYRRGYSSDFENMGGSYGDRGRSGYDTSSREERGITSHGRYGGLGDYEDSGYESRQGRGTMDYRESDLSLRGGRWSDDRNSLGRSAQSGYGSTGRRDWEREDNRSDYNRQGGEGRGSEGLYGSRGGWEGGSQSGYGLQGGSQQGWQGGSQQGWQGGSQQGWQGGSQGSYGSQQGYGSQGSSNYGGHGDNYRRGDRRSEFGRNDMEENRWGRRDDRR
jgi:hypothetical protein